MDLLTLKSVRAQIAQYVIKPCQLRHEKVMHLEPAGSEDGMGAGCHRLGFCSHEVRKHRLGCAHTMANENFLAVLAPVVSEDPLIAALCLYLRDHIDQIYRLDHKKGDLDKQHALAQQAMAAEEATALRQAIDTVVAEHTQRLTQMQHIRQQLLDHLTICITQAEKLMASSETHSPSSSRPYADHISL